MRGKQKPLTPWREHRQMCLIRVSSKRQEVKRQLYDLRVWFSENNLEWPPDEYVLKSKRSGFRIQSVSEWPEMSRALSLLESRECNGVVMTEVPRFFRNNRLSQDTHYRMLNLPRRPRVVFTQAPEMDIFTEAGKAWFNDEAAQAENYSLRLRRVTRQGKANRAARGETNASIVGYGQKRKRDGRVVWTKLALVVREAITLVHDGLTTYAAERQMRAAGHDVTQRMIYRWCTAPRYYGYVRHAPADFGRRFPTADQVQRAKLVRAKWRPLVPRRWFREIRDILSGNSTARTRATRRHDYTLRGLARCAHCGEPMHADMMMATSKPRSSVPGYRCSSARDAAKACDARSRYVADTVAADQIGEVIMRLNVAGLADQIRAELAAGQPKPARRTGLTEAKLRRQREQLAMEYAREQITREEFDARLAELQRQREHDQREDARASMSVDIDAIADRAVSIATLWPRMTTAERRAALGDILSAVTLNAATKRAERITARDEWFAALLRHVPGLDEVAPGVFALPDLDPAGAAVVAALRGGPLPATEIALASGLSFTDVRLKLRHLNAAGKIEHAGQDDFKPKRRSLWRLPTL